MSRSALTRLAVLATLAAAAPRPAAASENAGRDVLGPFIGSYRYVDSARDRRSWQQGVQRAIDSLNPMIRGFAAGQIRESVRPERRIAFEAADGGRSRVRFDGWVSPPMSLTGAVQQTTDWQGNSTRLSVRPIGEQLLVRSAASPGTRESFFSLSPDRAYLFMQVRVSSSRLPESIRYTLTYRRQ